MSGSGVHSKLFGSHTRPASTSSFWVCCRQRQMHAPPTPHDCGRISCLPEEEVPSVLSIAAALLENPNITEFLSIINPTFCRVPDAQFSVFSITVTKLLNDVTDSVAVGISNCAQLLPIDSAITISTKPSTSFTKNRYPCPFI